MTQSIKEYIKYRSISSFEESIDPNTDYKRVGVFVGHELFINKLSIETQVGYYIYKPFKEDLDIYNRLGLKYYLTDNVFVVGGLKTHLFVAEAFEFGIGIRLWNRHEQQVCCKQTPMTKKAIPYVTPKKYNLNIWKK